MAGSYTLKNTDFASHAAPRRQKRKVATRIAIAAGICLALTPVAVTAIVPDRPATAVELDSAVMNFQREGNAISLELFATDDGQRVYVEDASNNIFEIPVSPGQTRVSAELPATLAASDTLTLRVH
jgi:hypothetical protein